MLLKIFSNISIALPMMIIGWGKKRKHIYPGSAKKTSSKYAQSITYHSISASMINRLLNHICQQAVYPGCL
jgi:hypothetical protein